MTDIAKPPFWKRFPSITYVTARFPIAVLAMGLFTLIWIIFPDYKLRNEMGRLLVGLVVAGYICVIITLACEVMKHEKLYWLQLGVVIALAVIFYFSESLRLNLFMAIGTVLLALGNAVGWKQPRSDLRIWDFTHKLWTGAVLATVGSIIFMLGLLAIMGAMKTLLGIEIERLVIDLLMPIGLGFLAPVYWLSTLPPVDEPYDELYDTPGFVSKAIGFLGTWLLAPLTLIYAGIILTYGLKILLAWDLPKGEVAMLTTPFLIIGALTWLILEPPFIQKNALARWFRWLWFPVSLPAVLMLAIAIYIRIDEYGYTEERVTLVLVAIWAMVIGVWFTLKKEGARDIRLVPGVGAALLLIGTFTAQPLSILNQTQRVKGLINELELVDESGKLTVLKKPTAEETQKLFNLKQKIDYLYRKKAYTYLGQVFPNIEDVTKADTVYRALNVENFSETSLRENPHISFDADSHSIQVEGFTSLSGPFSHFASNNDERLMSLDGDLVKLVGRDNLLIVTHADNHVSEIDIKAAAIAQEQPYKSPFLIDIDERTRIWVKSLDMHINQDTQDFELSFMTFYVLARDGEVKPDP